MTRRLLLPLLAVVALASPIVALARPGKMASTKIGPQLCETTGGGGFVDIPGFPGEQIDRRLLRDVRFLVKRYKIFITDGYSTDPVHSANGEHPIGLALDIVPDKAAGGSWAMITDLAQWAEPRQDHPRSPFRWVGYDGDVNHGRGHHLHLSWNHSMTKPRRPAATVYTIRCPGSGSAAPNPQPPTSPPSEPDADPKPPRPPKPRDPSTGGVGGKNFPPVQETGGVSAPS